MEFEIRSSKRRTRRRDSLCDGFSVLPAQRIVQNKLIMRTLDDSIGKFRISIKLPVIFRNPLTVLHAVKGTEFEPMAHALLDYLRNVDKNRSFDVPGSHCYDLKLIELIEMFQSRYQILKHLPNWTKEESLADHTILEAFDLLDEIVEHRIRRSAQVELRRERVVHTLFIRNRSLRKDIDTLRRSVQVLKRQKRWKRIVPSIDVVHAQQELRRKEAQLMRAVNEAKEENARKTRNVSHELEIKVNNLQSEIAQAKNEYLKVRSDNEKELNRARNEKNKFLIQLQSVIEKHDRVLAEKFKENIDLEEELQKGQNEMEIFMMEYNAVEDEYHELLRRQEELWQERVDRFRKNRAARIIQRHWRRYSKEKRLKLQGKRKKNINNKKSKKKSRRS